MNFLIDFIDNTSADFISAYLADNNLTTVKEFDNYKNIFLVSGPNEPPKTSIVESIVFDDPKGKIGRAHV